MRAPPSLAPARGRPALTPRYSRRTRLVIGAATAWPFLYIAGFMLFGAVMALVMTGTAASTAASGGSDEPPAAFYALFGAVGVVMVLHFLTIFEMFALMGFYLWHAVQNEDLDRRERTTWVLLMFFLHFLVMPVYWWKVIWKAPEVEG